MRRQEQGRLSIVGIFFGMVLLGALAALFYASTARKSGPAGAQESTLAKIRREGVVRIGYANEPPYGYLDTDTGEVTGEAPEIAKVILRRLGVKRVEPVVTDFGQLIPGLQAGRFDIVAAGMYITPERCQRIAFSKPTYAIGESFIVAKGNPLDLHSFADVAKSAKARIGVMGGAVEQGYAQDAGVPEGRIVVFPDNQSALAGLETGRIDAIAATYLSVTDLLRKEQNPNLERAEPFADPKTDGRSKHYGAFGFRKDEDELREAFDRELAGFIGTPEHLELVKPFGFSKETLPGDVTAAELCAGQ